MVEPLKALCYAALADLFKYLPMSKASPDDVEIRQKLQLAAWMSLWPAKRDRYAALGLSHALGHKLGARYGIPHGITSVSAQCSPIADSKRYIVSNACICCRPESRGGIAGRQGVSCTSLILSPYPIHGYGGR